ncbi:MAG: HAD family hydrolase [Corynebacterium sp.]|nr:HAD family hydrolase [Corynebacterium sp.]
MAATSPDTPESPSERRAAAFFDVDKTVLAGNTTYAYGKQFYRHGLITPTQVLALSLAQTTFMRHGLSSEAMDTQRDKLLAMVAGWDVTEVRELISRTLHEVIIPAIYEEARELIAWHRLAGRDVVLVSASTSDLIDPIAAELGADHVIASELDIADGTYTGHILHYNKGEEKVAAIHALAAEEGYDLAESYAYSDSATDIPMLASVGHPVAVNPDRELRSHANETGWTILTFTNPIPLFPHPARTGLIAGATAAGIVAAVLGVRRFRHRSEQSTS